MNIGLTILRAVKDLGKEANYSESLVRFAGADWRRVIVTLNARHTCSVAIELLATAIEKIPGVNRVRWGPTCIQGTIQMLGPGWMAMIVPDGFRHAKDPPMKAAIIEVLYREVSSKMPRVSG